MTKTTTETFKDVGSHFALAPFEPIIQPIINDVLKEHGKEKYRKGTILTPCLLIWLCIALTFRRSLNYSKTLSWLLSGFRWKFLNFTQSIVKDSAISHARLKMGVDVFRSIFNRFVSTFQNAPMPDFYGFITVMFDGTSLTMPDTQSNCNKFGKHKSGRGYGAFPQMRVLALMTLTARRIIDIAYAPYKGKKTGEKTLMFQILKRCPKDKRLFLFDAGFYSFNLAYYMYQYGLQYILKIATSVKLKPIAGSHMPDGSYLAKIQGKIVTRVNPENGRKTWTKIEIQVRVIHFCFPGFRPVRLITSLSDSAINAIEIVKHYHKRWDIEIAFDEIKTRQCATLKGQMPTIFRSKHCELVEQELYALLITYNLIRSLIKEATEVKNADPLLISFTETLALIIECAPNMSAYTGNKKKQKRTFLLQMIAEAKIDRPRRQRRNPRVVKIKMSNFKRKRSTDKSECTNFMQDVKIIYQKAA